MAFQGQEGMSLQQCVWHRPCIVGMLPRLTVMRAAAAAAQASVALAKTWGLQVLAQRLEPLEVPLAWVAASWLSLL
jgi:hypothetical protein